MDENVPVAAPTGQTTRKKAYEQHYTAPSGLSSDSSDSYTYDHSGQDIHQKYSDELSQVQSQRSAALFSGDIGGALATGRRIADLKGYVDAYRSTGGAGGAYGGAYGEVVPLRRVASEKHDASAGLPGGGGFRHANTDEWKEQ